MTDRPQISVIMPVYNAEPFLKQAIDSVLTQTYRAFEFIIINDGSIDQTTRIIQSYQDKRIIFFDDTLNFGLAKRLNQGINLSRGQYIARMDGDDICFPERLEKQLAFLKEHPDVGVVGSNAIIINEKEEKIKEFKRPEGHELIQWGLFFGCPMIHPSVMFRRPEKDEWLKYNENSINIEDYDLWAKLIEKMRFYNIQEPLLFYRRHLNSVSFARQESQLANSLRINQKIVEEFLGLNVSPEAIMVLKRKFERPDEDLKEGAAVLGKLYRRFIRRYPMEDAMRNIIRADIASRLYRMGQASQSKSVRFRLLSEALWYNPRRMSKRYLNKVARRLKIYG